MYSVNPPIFKTVVTVVGAACASALILFLVSPLLLIYGVMYGIPHVAPLTAMLQDDSRSHVSCRYPPGLDIEFH